MQKIGIVFDTTSDTDFLVMLDQGYDKEKLKFSYLELSIGGQKPNSDEERIIARIKKLQKENPLLSRDQASISASLPNMGDFGNYLSKRFTYGWAECTIIGTLTTLGKLDMNRYVITPNAEVYTLSSDSQRKLFFSPKPSYIPIGTIETFGAGAMEEIPVTLNGDQLVTKHFCIFGMTGSGKTNTAAKVLEEFMSRGHRMIVFDSHDDYLNLENFERISKISEENDAKEDDLSHKIKEQKQQAVQEAINQLDPESGRAFNDPTEIEKAVFERLARVSSIIHKNIPVHEIVKQENKITSDLVTQISNKQPWDRLVKNFQIRHFDCFPELKFYGANFVYFSINLLEAFLGEDFTDAQKRWLRNNVDQQGTGLAYLRRLWTTVEQDNRIGQSTKSALQQKFNALQAIYNDAMRGGSQALDLEHFFQQVSDRHNGNPQTVYRLSLTNLSSNLRKALVFAIVTYCFRSFKFGGYRATGEESNAYPLLFILEEARSLIPKSSSDEIDVPGKLARRAMREIAYEGRKFSLGFGLISQKPSTVDPEVVSQSNTFILHQLKSPEDQRYVRDVTEGMSEDELDMVKNLGTGQAIVTGTAVKSSALVRVYFRYSQEGIQEPTPIADELKSIDEIRKQLEIE